jgi:hypothetical protein
MNNRCEICHQEPTPDCDWQQGRCPHREPLLKIQLRDTSRGHFYVSLVKSVFRIAAGVCIVAAGYTIPGAGWLVAGGVLLIGAEILGIVEELV